MNVQGVRALENDNSFAQVNPVNSLTMDQIRPYCIVKRVIDVFCSFLGLVILLPLFGIISFLIITTSKGPAIYKQVRIGSNGKPFTIYKFRTMISDADNFRKYLSKNEYEKFKIERKLESDPRITRVGTILRKTSLDELPQLANILFGDMSLVGPRPVVREELQYYGDNLKEYMAVKPGLTGLWQVSGRSNLSYSKRVNLDSYYCHNFNFKMDFKIIFKTFKIVFLSVGAC